MKTTIRIGNIGEDPTDENGKINKWMKREELDGRFQLLQGISLYRV